MIIDDYLESQAKLTKKYGKCVVLYAVGSFYEIYSLSEEFIQWIGELLNIIVTRRNKHNPVIDRTNHYMCGFPTVSLPRFMNVLLQSNLTVAVYDQEKTGNEVTRSLTATYSPSTVTEDIKSVSFDANNLMTVAFQKEKDWRTGKETVALGVVVIDLSTGRSWTYQTVAATDRLCALQDALRLLKIFQPREILLVIGEDDASKTDNLEELLEIKGRMVHRTQSFPSSITKIAYQNQVLNMSFPDTQMLTPIEFINLENKPLASTCLVHTLQFIREHDESILQRLHLPIVMNDVTHMLLENNAIQQLNVVPSPGGSKSSTGSLFDVVQFCSTNFGKRALKARLMMPLVETDAIQSRLDKIAEMLEGEKFKAVQAHLTGIIDLERLHRKVFLNKVSPHEIYYLYSSYIKCTKVFECVRGLGIELDSEQVEAEITAMLSDINKTFDMQELQNLNLQAMTSLDKSFLKRHVCVEADRFSDLISKDMIALEGLRESLNQLLDKTEKVVKLEYSDKECHYYFVLTKKRAETLKKILPDRLAFLETFVCRDELIFEFSKSQTAKINANKLREISHSIMLHRKELCQHCKSAFQTFVKKLSKNELVFDALIDKLTSLDVSVSGAMCAYKYNYVRPIINKNEQSFVEVESLRHPIIERLQTGIDYVPNDVTLGKGKMNGMLLYGINSSGKSSLMKALGLAVILAQAGFYVPAKAMTIQPFEKLMTRILSHDNLWKSLSSFACEMQELRGILSRADESTLVLGDELANSTETTSGISIVAASIKRLSTLNAKFLLSSHLHELAEMSIITSLSNVQTFHLECRYDVDTETLIYDRILKQGSGNARYGIEVCAASGFDDDFIREANAIRQEIIHCTVSCKKSRYNTRLMIQKCSLCGKQSTLETHHIIQQKDADEKGLLPGGKHKNDLSNLCVLCETCHDSLHNQGEVKITGWKMTSKGKKLQKSDNRVR